MSDSKTWDVRFTNLAGELEWLNDLMLEADARKVARQISDGLWGVEFRDGVALDRVADLASRFPVGARVVFNKCTEWERSGTVAAGHYVTLHRFRVLEVLEFRPDVGRGGGVDAAYVALAA
ncbi:hypothetical protein ACFRAQ_34880 [Nocardia sp. NPDC056611]|uniref:hypothetical protein n=1 Tax=Nocardia sp. NPDC056611 TaxID=3345877 RepID=UPI003671728F